MVEIDKITSSEVAGLLDLDKIPQNDLSDFVRTNLLNLSKKRDGMQLTLGQLLWTVKNTQAWKSWGTQTSTGFVPYASLDSYLENELGIRKRRAAYLIQLYDVCIIQLSIPAKILAKAHWSKVLHVVKYLTPENYEEIFEKISKMNQTEVIRWAKSLDSGPISAPPVSAEETTTTTTTGQNDKHVKAGYTFTPEQYSVFAAAISVAEKTTGVFNDAHNLALIAQEYLSTYGTDPSPEQMLEGARRTVAALKNVYGVDVEIKAVDPNINPRWEDLKQ